MDNQDPNLPSDPNASGSAGGGPREDAGIYSQKVEHNPVSARVPEKIVRGVMSTGVIVHDGPTEFVIDFLQGLSRPPQIAARVVLAPQTMSNFITALRENLGRYSQAFGPPPPLPKPSAPRPTVQELYDNFKLTDEQLSGSYANGVMVGHSPAEFLFDFVTGFYPTAAVSSRVFLAAPQVPPALEAFINAFRQFEQRTRRPPDGSPFR